MSHGSFEDKIVLVTGASRGIGKACLTELAHLGATVVGTATSEKGAADISAYLESENLKGFGRVLDVSKKENIETFFKALVDEIGAPTILVNNAGITRDNLMIRMKEEEWDDVLATNLTGVFHLTRLALKPMMKARYGRIINISSVVGSMGNAGQVNYASTKAALLGLTKSIAQEVGSRGLTANVVAPGFIDTDMTRDLPQAQREKLLESIPLNRLGNPRDIAQAVSFLASDSAGYITGQTLHVNGGMYMS